MLIAFLGGVNLALGALQGVEIGPKLVVAGIAVDEEADHKAGVDQLAESLLLQHVTRGAEDVGGLHSTVQRQLQPVKRAAHEL